MKRTVSRGAQEKIEAFVQKKSETLTSLFGTGERVSGVEIFPDILLRLYTLKYVKFCVVTCRLSRMRRFQHWRVFAHLVSKMPLRRMREDAKAQIHSHLPF